MFYSSRKKLAFSACFAVEPEKVCGQNTKFIFHINPRINCLKHIRSWKVPRKTGHLPYRYARNARVTGLIMEDDFRVCPAAGASAVAGGKQCCGPDAAAPMPLNPKFAGRAAESDDAGNQ
ncbi:MAG: hypothetical protein IJL93_05795 [Bacteroidales bacterium]|nr:hypothetical protein [Bacteroidales bacterium]